MGTQSASWSCPLLSRNCNVHLSPVCPLPDPLSTYSKHTVESIAVTGGSWIVIVVIWLQAWPFTNSSLTSKRQHTVQDSDRQQQPWVRHLGTQAAVMTSGDQKLRVRTWFLFQSDPRVPVGPLLLARTPLFFGTGSDDSISHLSSTKHPVLMFCHTNKFCVSVSRLISVLSIRA